MNAADAGDALPDAPLTLPRIGYVAAHWRGDFSLPLSFWVHAVALPLMIGLALDMLVIQVDVLGRHLRWGSALLLIGWPLWVALVVWGATGAWRAAKRAAEDGAAPLWTGSAKIVVGLMLAFATASTLMNFAPRAPDHAQLAWGVDPLGKVGIDLSPDRRRLRLQGAIGMGDAARVREALAGAAPIERVELDSPGGRLAEAQQIADLLRGSKPLIRVTGACDNACALVLMAGQRRQLAAAAHVGFHRAPHRTFNPVLRQWAIGQQQQVFAAAGLSDAFTTRLLKTPPTMDWLPDAIDFAASGLVSIPLRPLDIDLPAAHDATVADYADSLASNPRWQAIERRFPGSTAEAAARLQAARQQGADDAAVQIEGQRVAEAPLQTLLANASLALRIQYLELLADQLDAARALGAEACRGVLVGDTAARASLPPALAWRESAWLNDAMGEPDNSGAERRRPTALEAEVLRRSLGVHATALLSRLRQPAASAARDGFCEQSASVIAAVLKLPVAERRLAVRLGFDAEPAR